MSKKSHHNIFRSSDSYGNLFGPYLRDSNINLDRVELQRPAKKRRSIVPRTVCSNTSSSTCSSHKPSSSDSLHALSRDVLPIWRYSNTAGKPLQEAAEHMDLLKRKCITCYAMQKKKQKYQGQEYELPAEPSIKSHMPQLVASKASVLHRGLPIFEVLPPLLKNSTQNLVYQNSYLIDGIRYDFTTCQRTQGYGKLTLDYIKYLKGISAKIRPTDGDVVFGNAKVLRANFRGWDNSRIDWLLDLERKQEFRRKRRLQQKLPLQRSDSFVDICCFPFTRNLLVWNFG